MVGLTVNIEKSKFRRQEVNYLGYVLSFQGLRPNPDRVSAVIYYPIPRTKIFGYDGFL
jgi:hypothetical protein